jgi:neutral ceramidase
VVFLQGACGDVTQVNNLSPDENPSGEKWAQRVGNRVGAEAFKVMQIMPRATNMTLAFTNKVLQIPRRHPTKEKVGKALEIVELGREKAGATVWTFAKETLLLDAMMEKESVAEVEVQTVQVGPAVFVTNPAELFCSFGLRIKESSPFKYTWVVELANGSVGYVPTQEAFGPHGGGYETRLSSYTNLAIDAGDRMVETGLALARGLSPDPAPQFPKVTKSEPWAYGNLPPELE